jgi:bla regulator protein BlaR1
MRRQLRRSYVEFTNVPLTRLYNCRVEITRTLLRRMGRTLNIALTLLPAATAGAFQASDSTPQFEVASVKPADPNGRGQFQYLPGGTVVIRNVTVPLLIQQAFDVRDFQISGGPGWLNSLRYDITAKTTLANTGPIDLTLVRPRLQSLLADRFHLQLHHDTKVMSVYALVIAKNGPKLTADNAPDPAGRMNRGVGHLQGVQVDMRFLTVWLTRLVGRPVGDQTGLKGTYSFELNWVPDSPQANGVGDAAPVDTSGPSIFTAVQEQLGLRLERRDGPVDILVLDHVEKPAED